MNTKVDLNAGHQDTTVLGCGGMAVGGRGFVSVQPQPVSINTHGTLYMLNTLFIK